MLNFKLILFAANELVSPKMRNVKRHFSNASRIKGIPTLADKIHRRAICIYDYIHCINASLFVNIINISLRNIILKISVKERKLNKNRNKYIF